MNSDSNGVILVVLVVMMFIFLVFFLHLTFYVRAWELDSLFFFPSWSWLNFLGAQIICFLMKLFKLSYILNNSVYFIFFYIINLFISTNWWVHNFLYQCYLFLFVLTVLQINHLHWTVFTAPILHSYRSSRKLFPLRWMFFLTSEFQLVSCFNFHFGIDIWY